MAESRIPAIREMALRVAQAAGTEQNRQRQERWRRHNDLQKTIPPVLARAGGAVFELVGHSTAQDPVQRQLENLLKWACFKIDLGDDQVFEPWISLPAVFERESLFGLEPEYITSPSGGAYLHKRLIHSREDVEKIASPDTQVDETRTRELKERAEALLDGILEVRINRLRLPFVNLAYHAAAFLGIGNLLNALVEEPQLVHALMARLRDAHRVYFQAAEKKHQLAPNSHGGGNSIQIPLLTCQLPEPNRPPGEATRLDELWTFCDSQEFGAVSPGMFEKFFLGYHLPLLQLFGRVSFGCCECHHRKWHLIRRIPNLARVSVSPWTDLEEAVKEMGGRVVLNWRVNNLRIVTESSPLKMREEIRQGLKIAGNCPIEVILQDMETVYGKKDLLSTWVNIAREETERIPVRCEV